MKVYTDHLGTEVKVDSCERVVSLVPSITELLIDLGVNVVGRTKFCIHPSEKVDKIEVVGGTKKFRFEAIDKLDPTLLIGNKEENYKEGIEKLREKYPVWISDIKKVTDAIRLVDDLGELCDVEGEAFIISKKLKSRLEDIKNSRKGKVLYMIWYNPWMTVGNDTYIHHFLKYIGLENIINQPRYPNLDDVKLKDHPDFIFLSSEPFPFKESHINEIKKLFPKSKVELVNGEFFSWYGTRLLKI